MENKNNEKTGISRKNLSSVIVVAICLLTISAVIFFALRKENGPDGTGTTADYPTVSQTSPDTTVSPDASSVIADPGTSAPDTGTSTAGADISSGFIVSSDDQSSVQVISDEPISPETDDITTQPIETTSEPETDVKTEITTQIPPETTQPPIVTTQPVITSKPFITTAPHVTTAEPPVTNPPTTAVVTTQIPKTTAPITTQKPKETDPVIITPVETTAPQSPETTASVIEIPELKFGQQIDGTLIAPNGNIVEGYWIRDGEGTHFVVDEPVFEYGTTVKGWNYNGYFNQLEYGTYYYLSKKIIGFKPDVSHAGIYTGEHSTGILHTEQVYTAPPGTWW